MANIRRVFFVINSLEGGGAERVFSTVLSHIHARTAKAGSFRIELVLLDTFPEKYAVPADIVVHRLDCGQNLAKSIARLVVLARRERPDLLFSFLTRSNAAAIISGAVSGAKVVISERVHTSAHFGAGPGAAVNRAVVRLLYPRAEQVIAVSQGVAHDLAHNYGVDPDRLPVIHNPFDIERIGQAALAEPTIPLPDRFWLAIGRLVPNKNFAMLLKAYAASGSERDLVLLGEGPERAALTALTKELGIEGRVHMPGHVDNPFAVMARSSAYVMSSNAEGFPNALVEAMIVGVPVLATDCASGPAEILQAGPEKSVMTLMRTPHGLVVPADDMEAMASGLRLLADEQTRRELAKAARARGQQFGLDSTVARYEAVILSALERPGT
ncbi:MAG: glycosyltransferase [Hyphomonas sp.]|jgi:N-acetylgalactosamine-N,N'-diacetylbacillosaminyl-diphospho-undecaprenol 4-alpha-N-acetylgalactosaminyltransferase|nr:glycosyltransferase [Hyphomonas sp.]